MKKNKKKNDSLTPATGSLQPQAQNIQGNHEDIPGEGGLDEPTRDSQQKPRAANRVNGSNH